MASRLTQLESAALGFSCQPCGWRAEQGLNLEDREGRCQGRWGTAGMLEAEKEVGCRRVPSEGAGATVAPRQGGPFSGSHQWQAVFATANSRTIEQFGLFLGFGYSI